MYPRVAAGRGGSPASDPDPRRVGWRVQDHGPPGGSLPGLFIGSIVVFLVRRFVIKIAVD